MLKPLTDLKAILHSKRANIYYLEKCRVMQKDGKVVYLSEDKKKRGQYWNIPFANTTVILLGMGTSITQAAVRMLSQAGVILAFCGTGGTPLHAGMPFEEDQAKAESAEASFEPPIDWFLPQNEYRPTEYVQGWLSFWFHQEKRLAAAKTFQVARVDFIEKIWAKDRELHDWGIYLEDIEGTLNNFRKKIPQARTTQDLFSYEAQLTKRLYGFMSKTLAIADFRREPQAGDKPNRYLTHGNYLAYGLGATALWVLGIPHGFPVMHGNTRRGALVFDVADLIKDAIILPRAFIAAVDGLKEQEFRQTCLDALIRHDALEFMFNQVKGVALTGSALI